MRLLELQLRAYGPFTDRTLDLSAGREGLHIVFGPNEAGKSTALRALRALLFGIQERTPDAFHHDNARLRIGGRLRDADGNEVLCIRRKGRKDTLLGPDERPIPEDTLTRLLGGMDEPQFVRGHGIDYESLVSGGQALLEEQGREAETLFGAGLGSTHLRAVLQALDQEADSLFKPRGRNQDINLTLSQFAETQKQLRQVQLSTRHWEAALKDKEEVSRQLAALDERLIEANRRRATLERIRRTLPALARRRGLRERLAELGPLPVLTDGFTREREEATTRRRLATEARIKASARLVELRNQAAALVVSDDLLAQSEAIDSLREQLGSHRKAAQDRPALAGKAAAQREQARQRLAAIRPDLDPTDSERLRPLLGRRKRITELGGRQQVLAAAVRNGRGVLAETRQALTLRREELDALPPTPPLDGLRQAVAAARRAGDLDREVAEAAAGLRRHADTCGRQLGALGLWTGDLAGLRAAPLPAAETIHRFNAEYQAIDEEARRLDQARTEAEAEQRRTAEVLRAIQLAGAVPTEAALQEARAHRGHGWQLLKRQWLDGVDVTTEARDYAPGTTLPAAFESAVDVADEVVDRLRREAARVHEQAAAQARLETADQALTAIAGAITHLAERSQASAGAWQAVWVACGITPRSPLEMLDWLGQATRLRDKAVEGDDLVQRLAALHAQRQTQRRRLIAALAELAPPCPATDDGESLTPLLDHTESLLATLEAAGQHHKALQTGCAELETRRRRQELDTAAAETDLIAWESTWTDLMAELGLAPAATPGEVSDDLETIAGVLKLMDEAAGLESRVAAIDADAERFSLDASGLLARLAPDLVDRPVAEAVPLLHQRLGAQRETRSRLHELQTQSNRAAHEVQEAEAERLAADEALAALCRQAGCDQPDQLPAIEGLVRERHDCAERLNQLEMELLEGGDGLGLAELEAEAQSADLDAVVAELSALAARISQELQPGREALFERKIHVERDFAAMAGSDAAAALAEEAEHQLANLRAQAERYCRARLATRILRDEIERFRRRHRDPIMARAGSYFARLTCGAFASVATDFDESDQSVLVGVRPTEERLRVEALSTGTRDQLYLALRLATLDHYLDSAEPLPFIVDDILIQFDDDRARATLSALADFSARTQVILFTHHARVVEQARAIDPAAERVFVHEL